MSTYWRTIRAPIALAAHTVVAVPYFVAALVLALARRWRRVDRPRVVFGVTPIINVKYWSRALQDRGFDARSCVYDVYAINQASDYDHMPATLFPRVAALPPLLELLHGYLCSLWAMAQFDVYVLDFEGGFLRSTPFGRYEFPLLALARVRVIAIPYGGDVVVLDKVREDLLRSAFITDYPGTAAREPAITRWVEHYSQWASLIVCGGMLGDFVPRVDVAIPSPLAIDIDEWRVDEQPHRDPSARVQVLHAPNHRHLKGTPFLERACAELEQEGLPVELVICERLPNQEIRARMRACDIVVSALVMGYYELFAIEGMSMGKPVVNYWRPDLKALFEATSFAGECPIVDASPTTVKEALRGLIENSERRRALGAAGRDYVERHHSYAAVGEFFEGLLDRALGANAEAHRNRP